MTTEIKITLITGVLGALLPSFFEMIVIPWLKKVKKTPVPPINPTKKPTAKKGITFLYSLLGAVTGVLLGYFLISPFFTSSCPPFAHASVSITSPVEGENIPRLVSVQGTSCHIPKDQELWLLVLPEGGTAYYPQSGPVQVGDDGIWSASAYAGLDTPEDIGRGFVLVAVLSDLQGSIAIREYFSQSGPEYKGLEPIPLGVKIMSQVRVVRE